MRTAAVEVIYAKSAFEAADEKFRLDPAALNSGDLAQLELVDPARAARARLAREKALGSTASPAAERAAVPSGQPSPKWTGKLLNVIVDGFTPVIADLFRQRDKRIGALEKKIEELERRPAVRYRGVFTLGQAYGEASLVTHRGGLWVAERDTTQPPGDGGSSGWRLIVKSGAA